MIQRIVFAFLCLIINFVAFGQKDENFIAIEQQLAPLTEQMFYNDKDNERYSANEQFMSLLEDALAQKNSFSYKFSSLKNISILTSEDKKFRIFTWAIVNNEGTWENFGFIQSRNSDGEYELYQLYDRSEDSYEPQTQKLNDSTWFGAVYYKLITTQSSGKTYYTLLGWDGNDLYSQRSIIEPITFKSSARPIFGQNVFYKEKNLLRMIFEYSTDAKFTLGYEDQYYEISTNQKAKGNWLHKAKPFEKQEAKTGKLKMIFYDVLEPQVHSMSGLTQYYIPSGQIMGLKFENGKWKPVDYNVLPRNKPSQIDKLTPDNYDFSTIRKYPGSIFPNK